MAQGPTLRIRVLGSAAGGGSPQWNCRCAVCQQVREGATAPRTQLGLAVTADDGHRWVLLGASPDLRQQLLQSPALAPRLAPRHSPIQAVVLTGADVDAVAGLLTLREGHPFGLYAPPPVHRALDASRIFDVLPAERVPRRSLASGEPTRITDAAGQPTGVVVQAFHVPGKVPLYLEPPEGEPVVDASGDAVGLIVGLEDGDPRLLFVPSCASVPEALGARLRGAPLLLFDGTLWTDDELQVRQVGSKTGRRMGHVSMSGAEGSLARIAPLGIDRKVFVHVNNTNPALLPGSFARRKVEAAGWQVAFDGMELRA